MVGSRRPRAADRSDRSLDLDVEAPRGHIRGHVVLAPASDAICNSNDQIFHYRSTSTWEPERFALCVARPRPDRRPSAEDINRIGRTRSRPAAHLRPCLLSCVIPDQTRRQHTRTRCTHGARAAPTRTAHKAVLKVIGARPWAHSTCGRHIYVSVTDHIRVRDRIPITPATSQSSSVRWQGDALKNDDLKIRLIRRPPCMKSILKPRYPLQLMKA